MKSRISTILLIALVTITASAVWKNGGALASLFNARSAQALTLGPASIAAAGSHAQSQQGNGFTYQGSLEDGANPANGQYDFQFALYDAPTGGNVVGGTLTQSNQAVTNGLFSVQLDFGQGAFNGAARYLGIAVRPSGAGTYVELSPRQPITPAPYALFALGTGVRERGNGGPVGRGLHIDPVCARQHHGRIGLEPLPGVGGAGQLHRAGTHEAVR